MVECTKYAAGANDGPVYIHHNVAECSMGFGLKKEQLEEV